MIRVRRLMLGSLAFTARMVSYGQISSTSSHEHSESLPTYEWWLLPLVVFLLAGMAFLLNLRRQIADRDAGLHGSGK